MLPAPWSSAGTLETRTRFSTKFYLLMILSRGLWIRNLLTGSLQASNKPGHLKLTLKSWIWEYGCLDPVKNPLFSVHLSFFSIYGCLWFAIQNNAVHMFGSWNKVRVMQDMCQRKQAAASSVVPEKGFAEVRYVTCFFRALFCLCFLRCVYTTDSWRMMKEVMVISSPFHLCLNFCQCREMDVQLFLTKCCAFLHRPGDLGMLLSVLPHIRKSPFLTVPRNFSYHCSNYMQLSGMHLTICWK